MPIQIRGDTVIAFVDDLEGAVAPIEHELVAHLLAPDGERLVAAVWKARKVPYIAGEVAYHVYEGVAHSSKSEYAYWHAQGLAGCFLKPHLRHRLGLKATNPELITQLFTVSPAPTDPLMEDSTQ